MSWNTPLALKPVAGPFGAISGLSFEGWLWYYFHVVMHQTPANWAGEIEEYAESLRALDNPLERGT